MVVTSGMTPTDTAPVTRDRRGLLLVLIGGLLVALLAAGGATTYLLTRHHTKSYATATDVQAALKAGGFDCVAWTDEPDAIGPKSSGSCWHDGKEITVSLFDTPQTRESAEKVGADLAHRMGISVPDSGTFVSGGAWMVEAQRPEFARQVRGILGGEIR